MARQKAAQKFLMLLHPELKTWDQILTLYEVRASDREKVK